MLRSGCNVWGAWVLVCDYLAIFFSERAEKMSWKTFKFFEYEDVKDPETNEPFDKLKARQVSCTNVFT